MKKQISVALLLLCIPVRAYAIDFTTIATVISELSKIFGDSAPVPQIAADEDPCSLSVSFTNLRGPYGNYNYTAENIIFNAYWMGSIVIKAAEGFVRNDRLEISGTVQHRDEFCHPEHMPSVGPPLNYLFNLDLNNSYIASQIDELGQLVQHSKLGPSKPHSVHWDTLTEASVTANTFDNKSEIGLVNLDLRAVHSPNKIPDSGASITLLTIGLALICFTNLKARRP